MNEVRERLAILCGQVARHPEMREAIAAAGAETQLAQLLDAVATDGAPDQVQLLELLDKIEDRCSHWGLVGVTTSSKQYTALPPGFSASTPDEPVTWTCPLRRCSRAVFADEVTEPPSCAAAGLPMAATRVL
ncbi:MULTISPECIES: hypothetical protein [Streptomyces]|uniref:hypothetical protein n=1 Tax=Streptomyces TaxID=1883 RepID=UPI0004CD47FF|nr:hypothetical protein [Streptomyces durhamensis]